MNEAIQSLPEEIQRYLDFEIENIQGWMSPKKVAKIAKKIIDIQATSVVEIGVFAGRATIGIGLALKDVGVRGKCISIDPWTPEAAIEGWDDENRKWWGQVKYSDIHKMCHRQLRLRGIDRYVELLQETSDNAISDLKERNVVADVLIIDGNHSEEQSCRDVSNYLPLLRKGGSLFFDDSDWTTTQTAIDHIFDANLESQGLTGTLAHFIKSDV